MSSTPPAPQGETGLDQALKTVAESLGKTDVKIALLFGADTALGRV
ncbi:hypothetical protein [Streptosporangium nondiastaticum]|nr:hypothetical protein [Streptosporangium nondiastaticum]